MTAPCSCATVGSHSKLEKDLTIWLHGTLSFHLKGAEKQILHHKINATKAANRCSFPLALHTRLHDLRTAANTIHNHTSSLLCVCYFAMLHILSTWQSSWFSRLNKFHNSSLFYHVYSLPMSPDRWRAVTINLTKNLSTTLSQLQSNSIIVNKTMFLLIVSITVRNCWHLD